MKKKNVLPVKPVLSGHSKIDKTKILMTDGSLMKVESIAECSPWSILQNFWPALSNYWSWKLIFVIFLSGCLRQVLLYVSTHFSHCLPIDQVEPSALAVQQQGHDQTDLQYQVRGCDHSKVKRATDKASVGDLGLILREKALLVWTHGAF